MRGFCITVAITRRRRLIDHFIQLDFAARRASRGSRSGRDLSRNQRCPSPMYPIQIPKGNSVSQSAAGTSGVGCQRWNPQGSVCLHRPSRPRTNQTKTSRANPRQQRPDEIQLAPIECTNHSLDVRRWLAARTLAVTEDGRKINHFNTVNSRPSVHGVVTRSVWIVRKPWPRRIDRSQLEFSIRRVR